MDAEASKLSLRIFFLFLSLGLDRGLDPRRYQAIVPEQGTMDPKPIPTGHGLTFAATRPIYHLGKRYRAQY